MIDVRKLFCICCKARHKQGLIVANFIIACACACVCVCVCVRSCQYAQGVEGSFIVSITILLSKYQFANLLPWWLLWSVCFNLDGNTYAMIIVIDSHPTLCVCVCMCVCVSDHWLSGP